jgi:hypothetical protein
LARIVSKFTNNIFANQNQLFSFTPQKLVLLLIFKI